MRASIGVLLVTFLSAPLAAAQTPAGGRVTVRVAVDSRQVVEARRFANARIEAHELAILQRWAAQRGLSVASGL